MQNKLNLIQSKIFKPNASNIGTTLSLYRFKSLKIAFTNGCFDILHRGHVEYLCSAADLADVLVVGINDDDSVKKLHKGENRPINDLYTRMLMLSALKMVDMVIPFSEETPENLIKQVKPDVLVKGGDYDASETNSNSSKYIVGSDFVKSYGGLVKTIPLTQGFSTTNLINKLH